MDAVGYKTEFNRGRFAGGPRRGRIGRAINWRQRRRTATPVLAVALAVPGVPLLPERGRGVREGEREFNLAPIVVEKSRKMGVC
jgi:hypothetical protein